MFTSRYWSARYWASRFWHTENTNVTLALTGVSAAGAVGTVGVSTPTALILALSGVSAAAAVGTLTVARTQTLSHVTALGQVGSFTAPPPAATASSSVPQVRTDWARNIATGVPAGLAVVTVRDHATSLLSTLYAADGVTPQANPVTADAVTGIYRWAAASGRYDETVTPVEGDGDPYTNPDILLYAPPGAG